MKTVLILVFDGVEEFDAVGPYEVFGTANALEPDVCQVALVGETKEAVTCINGLKLLPHYGFDDAPAADVLVVPGGAGTRVQQENRVLVDWVAETSDKAELVASVCTGLRITLAAGLARGKRVTTHWSAIEEIRARNEALEVRDDQRFIRDGAYLSSAGVSAGIDMSLWIVGHMSTPDHARAVLKEIEYDPAPPYLFDV